MAQVVHTEVTDITHSPMGDITMWKDMPAIEALCLPSNEHVTKLWCPSCEILYNEASNT
jgi:hypothetical protein